MNPRSPLGQLAAGATLSLALMVGGAVPALGAHDSGCDKSTDVQGCSGGWKTPLVGNPAWWATDALYEHQKDGNNRPAWFHIKTSGTSPEPFEVTVEVSGHTVGSLDVFKVRPNASDHITPDCPQGFLTDLYPQGGEDFGSPSHLGHLRHVTLEHHRTILPAPVTANRTPGVTATEAYLELNRSTEWIVVVDIRGGTDATDGVATMDGQESRIDYEIRVSDGEFDTSAVSPPSEPLDASKWTFNADQCLTVPPLPT